MTLKYDMLCMALLAIGFIGLAGCGRKEGTMPPAPADAKSESVPEEGVADPAAEAPDPALEKPTFEKHVYYTINMANDSQLLKAQQKFTAARTAGYTHIVLDDTKFQKLGIMDASYFANCDKVAGMAREQGLKLGIATMHGGNANSTLKEVPNLAEGFKIADAPFIVRGGKAYPVTDAAFKTPFGDFEDPRGNEFKGFVLQDQPGIMSFSDTAVKHGGKTSIRFQDPGVHDKHGRARLCLEVAGPKFRAALLTFWVKTEGFDKAGNIKVSLYESGWEMRSEFMKHVQPIKPDQDWTQVRFLFNTMEYDKIRLYFGAWNAGKGKMWIDDVKIEEAGLLNIIQRTGCKLIVKGADGTVYEKRDDYLPVIDPAVGTMKEYHEAPLLALAPGSRIRNGDTLKLDFMHVWRITAKSTNVCPSAPETLAYYEKTMARLEEVFQPDFWLMYNDEIRVFNRCPYCISLDKTAGEIMADNIRNCYAIMRGIAPKAPIYIWSDMVDPHHNMKKRYYSVRGDLTGADKGLAPDMIIYKWAANAEGIKHFSDKGFKQILCGYYDSGDNAAKDAKRWYDASRGAENIAGVCYATWNSEYDHLEMWIKAVDQLFKP